jgi:K(+)-stimulated pyrophosphate-energized sodium pump
MDVITIWFVAWILALVFAFWKLRWVEAQSQGNDEIAKIAGHIRNGAMAFLNREYRVLGIFVAVVPEPSRFFPDYGIP